MQDPKITVSVKRFGAHSLWVGAVLILIGLAGVAAPLFASEVAEAFVAVSLISGGLLWLWHAFRHGADWLDWLKPLLLLVPGLLLAASPASGIASLALLIAFYLLLDAFVNASLAHERRGHPGFAALLLTVVIEVLLALLILSGWPQSSALLVGTFVGISLIINGWVLCSIAWTLKRLDKTA
jgi:uncharacterized membrane protein HdeD (DUF308 family)